MLNFCISVGRIMHNSSVLCANICKIVGESFGSKWLNIKKNKYIQHRTLLIPSYYFSYTPSLKNKVQIPWKSLQGCAWVVPVYSLPASPPPASFIFQKCPRAGPGMLLPTHFSLLFIPDSEQGSLVFPDTFPSPPTQQNWSGSLLWAPWNRLIYPSWLIILV